MEYENKTKTKLISEIKELSRKVNELQKVEEEHKKARRTYEKMKKNIIHYLKTCSKDLFTAKVLLTAKCCLMKTINR